MTLVDPCAAGACANYHCTLYGCRKRKHQYMVVTPQHQGCICPPTSEQTCQNPICPRKPGKETGQ